MRQRRQREDAQEGQIRQRVRNGSGSKDRVNEGQAGADTMTVDWGCTGRKEVAHGGGSGAGSQTQLH